MPHTTWLIPYFRISMQCTPEILDAILFTSFTRPASITADQFDFYGRVLLPILAEANALSFTLLTSEPKFEYRRVPKPLIEVYSKNGQIPECYTMYVRMNFWGESETYRFKVFGRRYISKVSFRTQTNGSGSNSAGKFSTLSVPFAVIFSTCAKNLRILGEIDQLIPISNPNSTRLLNSWTSSDASILRIRNLHCLCLSDWRTSINVLLFPRLAMNWSDVEKIAFNAPEELIATLFKKLIEFKFII